MRILVSSRSAGISYCRCPVRWNVATCRMRPTGGNSSKSRNTVARSRRSPASRCNATKGRPCSLKYACRLRPRKPSPPTIRLNSLAAGIAIPLDCRNQAIFQRGKAVDAEIGAHSVIAAAPLGYGAARGARRDDLRLPPDQLQDHPRQAVDRHILATAEIVLAALAAHRKAAIDHLAHVADID